jgi:hypothetical protein
LEKHVEGRERQIAARLIIGRLDTFKRHLIDMIVASEAEDAEIHAKALLIRTATDALIAEYAARLDYPPPAALPSTAPYLRDGEDRSSEDGDGE